MKEELTHKLNELTDKAIDIWGQNSQLDIMMEEAAELIQACSKMKRNRQILQLIEEIADVEIVIHSLKRMYNIYESTLDSVKYGKLENLTKTIEREEKHANRPVSGD